MTDIPAGGPSLAQAASDFDGHNARQGKTDKTRLWYALSLRYFTEFLADQGRPQQIADISLADAQAFLDRLKARGHKTQSVQCRSRALRAFFHWFDGRDDHRMPASNALPSFTCATLVPATPMLPCAWSFRP